MLFHSQKKEEIKRNVVNYKGECDKTECPQFYNNYSLPFVCNLLQTFSIPCISLIILSTNSLVASEYIYKSLEK